MSMKNHIVSDGRYRVLASQTLRLREREMRASIREKYAKQIATAGWWEKLRLKNQMRRELARESKHIKPSAGALFLHAGIVQRPGGWQPV